MTTPTRTQAPKPLRFRRVAPGMYEARTGPEPFDRYAVDDYVNDYGREPGSYIHEWTLTYPGEMRPDGVYRTKREAVASARAHHLQPEEKGGSS